MRDLSELKDTRKRQCILASALKSEGVLTLRLSRKFKVPGSLTKYWWLAGFHPHREMCGLWGTLWTLVFYFVLFFNY